ncbi:MAG TPA: hypothetical protein VIK99_09420 [Thermaerobacter sp.]
MAVILRLLLYIAMWLGGLAAMRFVLPGQPYPATFPQLAWPAAALALWGAAGVYGLLGAGWLHLVQGWRPGLRLMAGLVWAVLAALALLVGTDQAAASLAGNAPSGPALLVALLRARALWVAGLLLALAAGTLGARDPGRRRRFGSFSGV